MARIKTRDGGDLGIVQDYLAPIVGTAQTSTASSAVVAVATIAAGDIVLTQLVSSSSVGAYITYTVITAGTGFTTYFQGATSATLAYAVFHPNA